MPDDKEIDFNELAMRITEKLQDPEVRAKLMESEDQDPAELHCIMAGCGKHKEDACLTCGFYRGEAERRKKIPLTMGPGGLRRKVVGQE